MKQSRLMSLVESAANVAVGYGIAVATQILVFPLFGIRLALADQLWLGAIFTVVSIARSFALRRLFEAIRARAAERETAPRWRGGDSVEGGRCQAATVVQASAGSL